MNIEILVLDLCAYDDEQECVEFRENWFQPEVLGEIQLSKIQDGRVETILISY